MKRCIFLSVLVASCLWSVTVFSQTEKKPDSLGLPGDNLDLYATLDLFQKSKTIEDFEKTLNLEKTGINNLDLNLDKKVDFIKVVTKKEGEDFTFILQDAVSEKETQDVAVILVSKDKSGKVTMQIVGDPALYGKNYIVEPKAAAPAATANPGYTGSETITAPAPVNTTTVVVEQSPVVVYMYSPAYVPYLPPYHYGYYPPYFVPFTIMAVGIYHANHYNNYYHHGGYGNTTVVVNNNNYNNYNNNSRNTSNTVNHNNANGNYNGNRPSNTGNNSGNRPANTGGQTGNKPANTGGNKATTQPSTRPSNAPSASPSTKPSTSPSTKPSASPSAKPSASPSAKPSTSPSTKPSASPSSSKSSASPSQSKSPGGSGSRGGGGRGRGGRR
jgi:hypothetical protein